MPSFLYFWRHLTPEQQEALAEEVKVTRKHLGRVAGRSIVVSDSLIVRLVAARSELKQTMFL